MPLTRILTTYYCPTSMRIRRRAARESESTLPSRAGCQDRRVVAFPLRLRDCPVHRPVAELLALQGCGDVLQEGTPVADRQGLGGLQHGGELVIGETERAVGFLVSASNLARLSAWRSQIQSRARL